MLWRLGERVGRRGDRGPPQMLTDLALSDGEIRLAQVDSRYATTSTRPAPTPSSCRLAAVRRIQRGISGRSRLQPAAGRSCSTPSRRWPAFASGFDARSRVRSSALLAALLASYRDWGGTASPPRMAIVDWREVPTFSEFEILRDAFIALGVPTVICDPRDLEFAAGSRFSAGTGRGLYAKGERIDLGLSPRADQRHPRARDRVPRAARRLSQPDRLRRQLAALQDPAKKAFFAVLTGERYRALFSQEEREMIRRHVPWTDDGGGGEGERGRPVGGSRRPPAREPRIGS